MDIYWASILYNIGAFILAGTVWYSRFRKRRISVFAKYLTISLMILCIIDYILRQSWWTIVAFFVQLIIFVALIYEARAREQAEKWQREKEMRERIHRIAEEKRNANAEENAMVAQMDSGDADPSRSAERGQPDRHTPAPGNHSPQP